MLFWQVWQSVDLGQTWTLLGNAGWSARYAHGCVVFNGNVIVSGGNTAQYSGPTDSTRIRMSSLRLLDVSTLAQPGRHRTAE